MASALVLCYAKTGSPAISKPNEATKNQGQQDNPLQKTTRRPHYWLLTVKAHGDNVSEAFVIQRENTSVPFQKSKFF
jgi:hypothetical protein